MTHNQNGCVGEELLKNMKDTDALNNVLGYARMIESTQHSEHLSKVYLNTVNIRNGSVMVDAVALKNKCNANQHSSGKHNGSKHRS